MYSRIPFIVVTKLLGRLANYLYSMNVEYEWDEAKRLSNQAKHDADFSEIAAFEWETAVINPSPRYGELRYIATGFIGNRLYQLVYTMRGRSCRIVSLRKANPRESRRYERER